jgi:hypothetical protein
MPIDTTSKTLQVPPGPAQQKLRFLAKGTAMVPHYEAQKAQVRRFHGWKHDATLGPQFKVKDDLGRETAMTAHHGGFVKQLGQITAVGLRSEFAGEYIRHLRDGDLWPADEFTARQAGIKYDPTYGAEHDEAAKARHADELKAAQAMATDSMAGAALEEATVEVEQG